MKNQNDIIISSIAVLLMLIFTFVLVYNQRKPEEPPAVEKVLTLKDPLQYQPGVVSYADKLPNADKKASAGSGGGSFGGGAVAGPAASGGGGAPAASGGSGKWSVSAQGASGSGG